MPKILYVKRRFGAEALAMIAKANSIIAEYEGQGFGLTLRQLFYQFVSRDLISNTLRSYKNLGNVVNDGRLAGLIDWDHIQDRTRQLKGRSHWGSPVDMMDTAVRGYHIDMWANQKFRPEVWIEKDALVGVIQGICYELDIPYFSCRGYTSQSEMWVGAQRVNAWVNCDQTPLILHFGDHDPSGKDMTRDIVDRLNLFMGGVELKRMALNMDQIDQYKPPPNPAKITDSRAKAYIAQFGRESWELDALEPKVIVRLIQDAIDDVRDMDQWAKMEARLKKERGVLAKVHKNWDKVVKSLKS